jgi:MgtE intracellular N domain
MNTRHYRRISRKAADQLLDGAAGPDQGALTGPGQLTGVLAAAAAPGRADELAGEQMAVAAFEANHLASVADSRSEQMIKSPLAKILTVKVIAAALAVSAGGGVALAASTGTFSGSTPAARPSASAPATSVPGWTAPLGTPSDSGSPSPSASASGNPAGTVPQQTASPSASASASASAAPASISQTAAGLCRALAGTVLANTGTGTTGSLTKTAQEQALASGTVSSVLKSNSAFSSLVSTAQSVLNVPDYCALLLQLPALPQPADLVNLPVSLLSSLLTQLPVTTLAQDLTALPSNTLSQLLTELPVATVSQLLTSLPGSVVTQLFTALPASTATQLLNELPTAAAAQLVTELPTTLLSGLSGLSSSVLGLLPGL